MCIKSIIAIAFSLIYLPLSVPSSTWLKVYKLLRALYPDIYNFPKYIKLAFFKIKSRAFKVFRILLHSYGGDLSFNKRWSIILLALSFYAIESDISYIFWLEIDQVSLLVASIKSTSMLSFDVYVVTVSDTLVYTDDA